jgi:hypothetical protein
MVSPRGTFPRQVPCAGYGAKRTQGIGKDGKSLVGKAADIFHIPFPDSIVQPLFAFGITAVAAFAGRKATKNIFLFDIVCYLCFRKNYRMEELRQ